MVKEYDTYKRCEKCGSKESLYELSRGIACQSCLQERIGSLGRRSRMKEYIDLREKKFEPEIIEEVDKDLEKNEILKAQVAISQIYKEDTDCKQQQQRIVPWGNGNGCIICKEKIPIWEKRSHCRICGGCLCSGTECIEYIQGQVVCMGCKECIRRDEVRLEGEKFKKKLESLYEARSKMEKQLAHYFQKKNDMNYLEEVDEHFITKTKESIVESVEIICGAALKIRGGSSWDIKKMGIGVQKAFLSHVMSAAKPLRTSQTRSEDQMKSYYIEKETKKQTIRETPDIEEYKEVLLDQRLQLEMQLCGSRGKLEKEVFLVNAIEEIDQELIRMHK